MAKKLTLTTLRDGLKRPWLVKRGSKEINLSDQELRHLQHVAEDMRGPFYGDDRGYKFEGNYLLPHQWSVVRKPPTPNPFKPSEKGDPPPVPQRPDRTYYS